MALNHKKILTVLILFTNYYNALCSKVLRPRGVSLTKASLYDPSKSFTCFDGSNTVPFNQVNDDYCDCSDGSDEPGTAACVNGSFYCNNAGHVGTDISSSFVNDGVCDCCDTSDEYASSADCIDTCQVMGEEARREAKRLAEVQLQGYNIRETMAEEGLRIKKEKQARVIDLAKEKDQAELEKNEKLQIKDAAEAPEKEALEKYKLLEEELKLKKEQERKVKEEANAREAFAELDSDADGILTVQELQEKELFDTNKDGTVSEDEAKFYFQQSESMDLETFLTSGWALMKPTYMLKDRLFTPPSKHPEDEQMEQQPEEELTADVEADQDPLETTTTEEPALPEEENYETDETDYDGNAEAEDMADDEGEDDYDDQDPKDEEEEEEEEEQVQEIQYDEETQRLVDIATAARDEYDKIETHVKDLTQEISDLQDCLQKDFGLHEEFRVLEGNCFEFTDREYTYKLCPFSSAIQTPKSGHGETRLGSWGHWDGPADNIYSVMMYSGGQQCWNGPQRSAEVRLFCDVESRLVAVSEPNKCEYLFIFHTPAVCPQTDSDQPMHQHAEL